MQRRFDGMRTVVARIAAEGRLAPGWDIDTATAFVWALTAPSTFHLLVGERGWSPRRWARNAPAPPYDHEAPNAEPSYTTVEGHQAAATFMTRVSPGVVLLCRT